MEAGHLYCTCQVGAEAALKREVGAKTPEMRFAFSRPGFVTFKLSQPLSLASGQLPRFVFARTRCLSLGKVSDEPTMSRMVRLVAGYPALAELVDLEGSLKLHVWQRDSDRPGEQGFEPGTTELAREVHQAIVNALPSAEGGAAQQAQSSKKRATVLDVAMVEPNEWWLGCHRIETRVDRWPGGIPPLALPGHAVSRAYLKMREALAWSRVPAVKGDQWVELGCAPGGASQALLDAGMRVIGVDPADVDPTVAAHPDFSWLKMRAADCRKREYAHARWVAADINAAPSYTLDAVEEVVSRAGSGVRGLLLTLKLPDWSLATPDLLEQYVARVRSWGYQDVRLRQLAFNRREICLAALRSRSQRRMRRGHARRNSQATQRHRGAAPCRRPPE